MSENSGNTENTAVKSPVDKMIAESNREKTTMERAREIGNVWKLEGREMMLFLADGKAFIAVDVIDRATRQPTGATLIHNFEWDTVEPFARRERSLKTELKSKGRETKQEIDSANISAANTKLYQDIVAGGKLVAPDKEGVMQPKEVSREQMLQMATNYPELASEAIESWLDSWHFEVISDEDGSFDWIFSNTPVVKVLGWIGLRTMPDAAVIITFDSPSAPKREKYEDERQKINSDRRGEYKIVDVQESFTKKIQYGSEQLKSVEGVAIGEPGKTYQPELKEDFIKLFNPLSFAEAVDKMHESFDFTRGKAAGN